jgi:hypothetical protein
MILFFFFFSNRIIQFPTNKVSTNIQFAEPGFINNDEMETLSLTLPLYSLGDSKASFTPSFDNMYFLPLSIFVNFHKYIKQLKRDDVDNDGTDDEIDPSELCQLLLNGFDELLTLPECLIYHPNITSAAVVVIPEDFTSSPYSSSLFNKLQLFLGNADIKNASVEIDEEEEDDDVLGEDGIENLQSF